MKSVSLPFAAAFTLLLLVCNGTADAANRVDSLRVYSDVCVHPETGDILGTRIALVSFNGLDTYAIYQEGEGGLEDPRIAPLSPDDLKKSRLSFTVVPPTGETQTVRGTISEKEIDLTSGGDNPEEDPGHPGYDSHGKHIKVYRLKRVPVPSLYPDCR